MSEVAEGSPAVSSVTASWVTSSHGRFASVRPVKADDLIQLIERDPYDFDPGKTWLYDNSGYFLLGYIVEKVSGQSYAQFLRANFFAPLGMADTGIYHSGRGVEHEATGYQFEGGRFSEAPSWDTSWMLGAGSLYSTDDSRFEFVKDPTGRVVKLVDHFGGGGPTLSAVPVVRRE